LQDNRALLIILVAAAELTRTSIFNGLDCQTAFRDCFGPQRLSGAVSNLAREMAIVFQLKD
jgi:hypothetical protein